MANSGVKRLAAFALALAALAAPAAVVVGTHAAADSLGRNVGALAAKALVGLKPAPLPPPPAPARAEPISEPKEALAAELIAAPPAERRRSPPRGKSSPPRAALGVRVTAQRVLELARQRAIPSAAPVAAVATQPAGLRLSGVAGLGVGMRDGDILTRVAGTEVRSVGAVADLVIRARARQAPEISAEFWRDGVRGMLVVEQPYPSGDATARTAP